MGIQSFLVLRLSRRRVRGRLSAIILSCLLLQIFPTGVLTDETATDLPSECRLSPHYRTKSPLDELLRRVQPQLDAFPTEALADEVEKLLEKWQKALQKSPPELEPIAQALSPGFQGYGLLPSEEKSLRSGSGLEILQGRFANQQLMEREAFIQGLRAFFEFTMLQCAEFKLTGIQVRTMPPLVFQTRMRYDVAGRKAGASFEERVGAWNFEWERDSSGKLWIRKWQGISQTRSRAERPIFRDVTAASLGKNRSYQEQLLRGADHWRTVLDGASGIDVYGNNGIAVGDFDNDGFDDLYVCQPAGLPNRLYRNRGDGTFEDVTEVAGVAVLDPTACALFADLDNDGDQDLLVVSSKGPLLFLNQKNGTFRLKPDAFSFAQPPQGTFTAVAAADYDRDGRLDLYFCLYSYYQGLDQYRFPSPYHDAQNGPPNFLLRNIGDGTFRDVTSSAGLGQNNNRYSFACGWGDFNNDGWPDLYVANDFGRKNLYRNNSDGTFTDVAGAAGVEDVGAGMSVCWFDYDNDGREDLYVANMWTAEGKRVSGQEVFMSQAPETVRAAYRKHANGNSLFRNMGNGRFRDSTAEANVEMGRWAWSADAWDFDHDGYSDLYVVDGMISGSAPRELNSFFWRQVVPHSPVEGRPERSYEQGWNAINELIRADGTWSGYERNVFYLSNGDGTFSDISATSGLDFPEDGRAFALSDIDQDGRLELILKNRDAPQIRVLRNELAHVGHSIAFRLRGTKSNRDAIGARITVEAEGRAQSKSLQAGSGFLSQHTKEVFFGLGMSSGLVRATVRWPSGLVEKFEKVPDNCRIQIEEGSAQFRATPFAAASSLSDLSVPPQEKPPQPSRFSTWLLVPLPAPEFSLSDLEGRTHTLQSLRGRKVLLNFWMAGCRACQKDLEILQQQHASWASHGLQSVAINLDDADKRTEVQTWLQSHRIAFPSLFGNQEVAAIYNILYRYLYDRRRNLPVPISFLLDEQGMIVKLYQGGLDADDVLKSVTSLPKSPEERIRRGLPFPGQFYLTGAYRNMFTYGVAYYERGYFDQAAASFQAALRDNPDYPEAHYNLGTLYLKSENMAEAREHFQRALQLRPEYPDALNNLGLIAAEQGRWEEALHYFRESIRQKPNNGTAFLNLGNVFREQGRREEAMEALQQALHLEPQDPEIHYSLGMLYAQREDNRRARDFLEKAVKLQPDYPEALNNLGVLYLRIREPLQAVDAFQKCIRVAAGFDQPYLNLAKAHVANGDRRKAEEVLRRLLEIQPHHPMAQKMLEQFTRQH